MKKHAAFVTIGLEGALLLPGLTATLRRSILVPFKGERLHCVQDADAVSVLDIKAGTATLIRTLPDEHGTPATAFLTPPESPLPGVALDFPTVGPGWVVQIDVLNTSARPVRPTFVIHGKSIEQSLFERRGVLKVDPWGDGFLAIDHSGKAWLLETAKAQRWEPLPPLPDEEDELAAAEEGNPLGEVGGPDPITSPDFGTGVVAPIDMGVLTGRSHAAGAAGDLPRRRGPRR